MEGALLSVLIATFSHCSIFKIIEQRIIKVRVSFLSFNVVWFYIMAGFLLLRFRKQKIQKNIAMKI